MNTCPVLSRLFLLVAGALFLTSNLVAQEYVSEAYRFSMVPPKGFTALPDAEVKAMFQASRERMPVPEGEEGRELPPAASISKVVFMPQAGDLSSRSIIVHAAYPPARSVEEFEKLITPDIGDFVVHAREIVTLNYRQCFLIDRELDTQGIRMRQLCGYVPGIMPGGYLINFSAVSVDFDEYRASFVDSLKTFKPLPPKDVAPEVKQSKYSGAKGDKTPAWRSPEVILSLVFVAAVVIWFLVRRLSAGAEEESAKLPGDEDSGDK